MDNIRFWEFINDSHVKITLRPGQRLHHWQGGPTDEGWSSTATTWHLSSNGRVIERQLESDGRDCDGRLTRYCEQVAKTEPDTFVPMYYAPELMRPDWQDADIWQRDEYAEAAGY